MRKPRSNAWTIEQLETLARLSEEGASIEVAALAVGRTQAATEMAVRRKGLKLRRETDLADPHKRGVRPSQ